MPRHHIRPSDCRELHHIRHADIRLFYLEKVCGIRYEIIIDQIELFDMLKEGKEGVGKCRVCTDYL